MRSLEPVSIEGAGYKLRAAGSGDLDLILDHRRRMFLDMGYSAEATERSVQANTNHFRKALAEGRYRGFFIEETAGQVVAGGGVITYDFHTGPRETLPARSWIVNVYTDPAHRRRGLAREIMKALVAMCRELGWVAVFLHASPEGRALYESIGFTATNEMVIRLPSDPMAIRPE